MRVAGSLRRRLLLAALAVMAPLLVGAGLWVILASNSASTYKDLTREVSVEAGQSVALLQGLNAAQGAGSRYMEGGSETDLRDFQRSAASVDRALAGGEYDAAAERYGLVAVDRSGSRARTGWRPTDRARPAIPRTPSRPTSTRRRPASSA